MKSTQATRKQFYIALDMGCGTAHYVNNRGYECVVKQISNHFYTVTIVQDAYGNARVVPCNSAHSAMRVAMQAIPQDMDVQPLWRPFVPRTQYYLGGVEK